MKYLGILAVVAALLSSCGSNPSAGTAATGVPVSTGVPDPVDTPVPIPTDAPVAPSAVPVTNAPVNEPTIAPVATVFAESAGTQPGVAPIDAKNCPPDHPIKGNITTKEKIYHVPGGGGYAQTQPEQCFATSKDAEAAGFRAVKN